MHTIEINSAGPKAQRYFEVALSLAQAMKANFAVPLPNPTATPGQRVSWLGASADWLDTPADHCSPLDDY